MADVKVIGDPKGITIDVAKQHLAAARSVPAVCDRFGCGANTTTAFDIFSWLQVAANFDDVPLLQSAPNRPDYVNIFGLWLHATLS
jgi:hypothetical protein